MRGILNQYFVSDGQKSIISSDFKKDILFSRHNLVTDGVKNANLFYAAMF
jgi:chemotaxis methyl-accepting protein methylase